MAAIEEAIRRLIFEYVSEGADEVIKQQEEVAASTTKTDKASLSLEKAFGSLERRYVDTVRHQQDYAKVQEKVNAAVAQNPALQDRANALLAAAGEHYDKLAFNATKGGVASSFLSKAITAVLGPAGLMGAAMTGVGVAVGYMASQFQSASTTIEQALEEQNRLLKEGKTLLDAKASAESKTFAQSKELTQFQLERSERDLRGKLGASVESTIAAARSKATTPTQVAGEMGEAPTGEAPLGPGYDKIAEAMEKLKAASDAGLPGLAAFQMELAKVGTAHPELAKTVEELIKVAQTGIATEQAALKVRAISDALKSVATDAQLAAVGLGSVAQFQLNNMMATQAAEATERQAKATLAIAAQYPGMSVEVAKQLNALDRQLPVIQARTGAEKIAAQEIVRQNQLLAEGKTREEAIAIAAKERRNAEAAVNVEIDKQIKGLDDELELIRARAAGNEADVKAAQAYRKAIEAGADATKASQIASATLRNERERAIETTEKAEQTSANFINNQIAAETEMWNRNKVAYDQLIEKIGFAHVATLSFMNELTGAFSVDWIDTKIYTKPGGGYSQFDPEGYLYVSGFGALMDQQNTYLRKRAEETGQAIREIQTQWGPVVVRDFQKDSSAGGSPFTKFTNKIEELTKSTDALNSTMQNALSPYYSMDPRTTRLGFRAGVVANPALMAAGASNDNPVAAITGPGSVAATRGLTGFAGGGSFTVPGGYSATDNRMVAFAARSGETVTVATPGQKDKGVTIDNRVIINGNVDADTMDRLKRTQFQQAQRMREMLAS